MYVFTLSRLHKNSHFGGEDDRAMDLALQPDINCIII